VAISPLAFAQAAGNADPNPAVNPADTSPDRKEHQGIGKDHTSWTGSESHKIPQRANKASELIGMKVRNAQQEDLGTIKDIVLDLDQGRVAYAVMATGKGFLGLQEKLVAVPLFVLKTGADQDYLTLNASKEKLDAAKGFDSQNYPAMQQSAWGAEPFWDDKDSMLDPSRENQPGLDRPATDSGPERSATERRLPGEENKPGPDDSLTPDPGTIPAPTTPTPAR
jgi:sporulation protein YlmC with PRC-barrel domain